MKRHTSIKSKLLLLLLATIFLTILLIGIALDHLIERYYQEEADKGFSRVYRELSEQLRKQEFSLSSLAQRLSLRDDVVSGANMIFQYATPEDYSPLVYDGEKRKLAKVLQREARASFADEVAAYTAGGELISFYSNRNGQHSGYLSYRDGRSLIFASSDNPLQDWQRGALPQTITERIEVSGGFVPGVHYRSSPAGLAVEFHHDISRTYPDGNQLKVGYIRVRKYLGDDFVNELSQKTAISTNLILPDGSAYGEEADIETDNLTRVGAVAIVAEALPFTRHNLDYYYSAALKLRLEGGDNALFLAVVPKHVVSEAINDTRSLVLLVLILSAAFILPLGVYVSNRALSQPLQQLAQGVKSVERGYYDVRVEVETNDELHELAHAFNLMSDSIHQRETALMESEDKYRTLVDNLPQRVFFKDRNSVYISCNRAYAEDVGVEPNEIVGKTDFDLFSEAYARQYRLDDARIMAGGEIEELEEEYVTDNASSFIQTVKTPIKNSDGEVVGILGIFWDITEKKLAESSLRQSAAVFENTADGVIVTDEQARIIAVNKAFTEITGYSEEEVLGRNPSFRRSEKQGKQFYRDMWRSLDRRGRWQGEIWNRRKSGEVYPEWMTISTVSDTDGRIINYVSVFSDITHVKRSQMQLDHMAHHDPLTDLPNRTLLDDRLSQAILRAERNSTNIAVLFIDLDRFKNVNDTLGHPSGDLLLQDVARRLKGLMRQQDTVARLGGDEFILVIENMERPDIAETIAAKIIDVLSSPFTIHGQELFIGASIGISLYPTDGASPDNLIKYADTAMYRAKEKGRNTYQFYTQELTKNAVERMALESALRRALDNDELELYFQPQIELSSGKIIGAEALLRWHHPEEGMVPPDRFIPLAEDSGLIIPIGQWVLEVACEKGRLWHETYPEFERMAVNLSAVQLQKGDFISAVQAVIDKTGIDPSMLELEITESVLMQFPDVAHVMLDSLRGMGIELAIDDFGTGYSSLSYLKRFPIQILKIDRSFVMDIPHDSNDAAITRAVIALGKSLQMRIVAEGVETKEQEDFLLHEHCDIGQGYYYSRPVGSDEFTRLLENQAIEP